MTTIAAGGDHAGFHLRQQLVEQLTSAGHTVTDIGCETPERCDYPDFGKRVGKMVASGEAEYGLVVCGSGIGIAMAANRIPGARAARITSEEDAQLSRQHNNANIASFGERLVDPTNAARWLQTFLETDFEGGRHTGRVEKLDTVS